MLSIIQAAGWPIWPLIACSVLGMALIFERFVALKTARVAPPKLLDEAITVSSKAVPTPDVVNQLAHGISIALYNTAFGLIVAIPALIFWRYFRARVDAYLLTLELASEQFVRHILRLRKK